MRIPLFPLRTVLFPDGQLPLQIFEVRYLDMVKRCQQDGTPFGVVCLSGGREVRQADASGNFVRESFHPAGTLAQIVTLQQPQPGLLLISCQGGSRFKIEGCEQLTHGLWTADVTLLDADLPAPVPSELRWIPLALRRLREQMGTEADTAPAASLWQDAGWVANRWAELLPLPPESRQNLLLLDSPLLRLELVGDALEQLGIS